MIPDSVLASFKGKRALVTGGTGLIGRQVVDLLCRGGATVTIVSLDKVEVHPQAVHVYGDITHLGFCLEITLGMDCVFHLAGVKGSAAVSQKMLASHFVPTLMMNTNMLEASRRNGVTRTVYTSSIGAYRNAEVFVEEEPGNFHDAPMDFAGWAKRMAELQIHAYKTQFGLDSFSIVRPSNVYGPGDNFDPQNAMVIGSLMHRIHSGEKPLVVWGDGSAIRDLVFSRDVAEGIILALHHGTQGGYVNLGSGLGVSIRELIETLRSFLDFEYVFDPSKPGGYPKRLMDISLARQRIQYNPTTPLREGLQQTWDWFLSHQDEYRSKKNYFKDMAGRA
jgi:GDP-L-fucose synthase